MVDRGGSDGFRLVEMSIALTRPAPLIFQPRHGVVQDAASTGRNVMSSPQEQFAAAVRSTQAQAVDAVETWTKITQDAFGKIGDAPGRAPKPDDVIDQVFDFAEKMLEGQREFAHRMLGVTEKVGEAARDEIESATEKVRDQVEARTEAARRTAESVREDMTARTEAARKQAETILEEAKERAEAASKQAKELAEAVLAAARQQAEQILELARKQAKTLAAPLNDIAEQMTKAGEQAWAAVTPGATAEDAVATVEGTVEEAVEEAVEDAAEPEVEETAEAESADEAEAQSEEAEDYAGWTKVQLQEELVNRGLPKSGNVAELRERLRAAD
jgi:hypothetical protein